MSILPRLLYFFQNLPVEVDNSQFREWDKWISRFIWQGKKPRICFNTLQLENEGGGMTLPCLRNYFYASQIISLLYWCNGEYKAHRKEIEFGLIDSFPLQASIVDKGSMTQLEKIKNSLINLTLKYGRR